jgi:hypothetical protein
MTSPTPGAVVSRAITGSWVHVTLRPLTLGRMDEARAWVATTKRA